MGTLLRILRELWDREGLWRTYLVAQTALIMLAAALIFLRWLGVDVAGFFNMILGVSGGAAGG